MMNAPSSARPRARAGYNGTNAANHSATQRLRIGIRHDDKARRQLPHELDVSGGDIHVDFASVGRLAKTPSLGREADGFQVRSGDDRVRGAGIDQEQPLPASVRLGRIPDGSGNVCRAHFMDALPPVTRSPSTHPRGNVCRAHFTDALQSCSAAPIGDLAAHHIRGRVLVPGGQCSKRIPHPDEPRRPGGTVEDRTSRQRPGTRLHRLISPRFRRSEGPIASALPTFFGLAGIAGSRTGLSPPGRESRAESP